MMVLFCDAFLIAMPAKWLFEFWQLRRICSFSSDLSHLQGVSAHRLCAWRVRRAFIKKRGREEYKTRWRRVCSEASLRLNLHLKNIRLCVTRISSLL